VRDNAGSAGGDGQTRSTASPRIQATASPRSRAPCGTAPTGQAPARRLHGEGRRRQAQAHDPLHTRLETAKNEFGLDHNESRSWHGYHRHVSLVMLAFAMMAAIRHRANPPPPKTPTAEPRQRPKHSHAIFDPLVNPGSPPHRHQTRSEADPTRTYHRMVTLAQSSPSCHSVQRTSKQKRNCNARLRDRSNDRSSISIDWQIGSMAIRADEAGGSPASGQILLLPQEPEPPETLDVDQRRRSSARLNNCYLQFRSSGVAKYGIPCSPFAVTCDDHI
jgi:hypothetical protein